MLSGNPTLNENTFRNLPGGNPALEETDAMTVQGTVTKTMILLGITVVCAIFTWGIASAGSPLTMPIMIGGAIGGLILALATVFKPHWAPNTAVFYAICEGLFLGAISALYEMSFGTKQTSGGIPLNGIVVQAVGLTLGVFATMLILYTARVITVTAKLRAGIMMATGGVMLFYLVAIGLSLFGVSMPLLHNTGPLGIGLSLLIVGIAAFNLLIDFDMIERGAAQGAPKYMEWYGGFSLLVTLVWLYLEILRLLSKLRSR
ncbi:MAG: Bax inhibitor-1/YccA family protein [Planctomycetota bacterium]